MFRAASLLVYFKVRISLRYYLAERMLADISAAASVMLRYQLHHASCHDAEHSRSVHNSSYAYRAKVRQLVLTC
jgi:hypothetical protein